MSIINSIDSNRESQLHNMQIVMDKFADEMGEMKIDCLSEIINMVDEAQRELAKILLDIELPKLNNNTPGDTNEKETISSRSF